MSVDSITATRPAPRSVTTFKRPSIDAISACVLAVIGALAVLMATSSIIGLGPDSATYLSAAVNFSRGHGLSVFDTSPLAIFGPAYPRLIAAVMGLGLSPLQAARWINAVAAGATVWLAYLIIRRHVTAPWIRIAATATVLISSILLQVEAMAWSEPLFIALSLLLIVMLESILAQRGPMVTVILAGMVAAVAFLDRYAGLALILLGVACLISPISKRNWRRPLSQSAVYLVFAGAVPLVWMMRNHAVSGTYMGARYNSSQTVASVLSGLGNWTGRWLIPTPYYAHDALFSLSRGLMEFVGLLVLAGVFVAAGYVLFNHRTDDADASRGTYSLVPLLLAAVIYAAYLAFSELTTALDPINPRLFSPLAVPLIILAAVGVERLLASKFGARRGVKVALAVIVGIVLVNQVFAWQSNVRDFTNNPYAVYSRAPWTNSPLSKVVAGLPATEAIQSNVPFGLWIDVQNRTIVASPLRTAYSSGQLLGVSQQWIDSISCTPTYLAWFRSGPSIYLTPLQLSKYVQVKEVNQWRDGYLYTLRIKPGTTAACH